MQEKLPAIVAIGSLTVLEIVALMHDVNGTLLSAVIAAVAGLGGYSVGRGR